MVVQVHLDHSEDPFRSFVEHLFDVIALLVRLQFYHGHLNQPNDERPNAARERDRERADEVKAIGEQFENERLHRRCFPVRWIWQDGRSQEWQRAGELPPCEDRENREADRDLGRSVFRFTRFDCDVSHRLDLSKKTETSHFGREKDPLLVESVYFF
jgi:hypothetical protein